MYTLCYLILSLSQVGEEVIVFGPDVLSTCGQPGRVLEMGTVYLVGIGHRCSPITQWTPLSDYSSENLDLLRRLRVECGAVLIQASMATTLILLIPVMLFLN